MVDTSVIIKWFVQEDGHADALSLLDDAELVCPDFAFVEAANVLWRKVRLKEISADQMKAALKALPEFFREVVNASPHISVAAELSGQLDHSVYDCLFLAIAAKSVETVLVSADERFLAKCIEAGFADKVQVLGGKPVFLDIQEDKIKKMQAALDLYLATRDNVLGNIPAQDFGGALKIRPTSDFAMALQSPAMVRLKNAISALKPKEAQSIIAICWFGRGYGSNDFEHDFANAAHLAESPGEHAPYISGLLQYYEAGLERLRLERPDLTMNGNSHG